MTYSTSNFSEIDSALENWAKDQGVEWIRDDRGWDVRTLFWRLPPSESVQLWVDEPTDGKAVVHVCHNTAMGGQQHTYVRANVADLEQALSESLDKANALATELGRNVG